MCGTLLLTSTFVALSLSIGAAQLKKEATAIDKADPHAASIARGVDYLKVEVPKWKAEHPCYSCHNNGDATRALLVAGAKGYDIGTALDDTLAFLKQPSKWDQNKAPSGFDDKALARVQFASALAVAERHGKAASTDLDAAAKLLVADQQADGSWQLDQSQSLGSPATYGTLIATWSARTTLISSGMQPDNFTIVQADKWLRGLTPENVLDASATVLALELASDVMAENLRRDLPQHPSQRPVSRPADGDRTSQRRRRSSIPPWRFSRSARSKSSRASRDRRIALKS